MTHSAKQRLIFFQAINQAIENPHLSMYIRELLKGQDIQTKRYLKKVPIATGLKQDCYEKLWAYCKLENLSNRYLENTLESVILQLDPDSWEQLKQDLQTQLEILNLPAI